MELDATGKATLSDTPPKDAKTAQGDDHKATRHLLRPLRRSRLAVTQPSIGERDDVSWMSIVNPFVPSLTDQMLTLLSSLQVVLKRVLSAARVRVAVPWSKSPLISKGLSFFAGSTDKRSGAKENPSRTEIAAR